MSARVMDGSGLAALLRSASSRLHPFGMRLVHLPTTGSTNDVAGQLASGGAPEGTLVVADAQTAGRGRMGHTWFSPPLAGLYVSVVLRPCGNVFADRASVTALTLMAGVALADGLRAASGVSACIKWPNDIVIASPAAATGERPRKVAGILAEGAFAGGALQHVVLGYGVNLAPAAYPPDIAERATSLDEHAPRAVDRGLVLVETLAALAREYAALATGDVAGLLARWRERSPSCEGAAVTWTAAGARHDGVTAGIDRDGALLVRTRTGHVEALRAGEVTWR